MESEKNINRLVFSSQSILSQLFPNCNNESELLTLIQEVLSVLDAKSKNGSTPRFCVRSEKIATNDLLKKYNPMPENGIDKRTICKQLAQDFFTGVPRWRSPKLQYNVGAPVNIASTAMYALAMDENIFNINDGLAGNVTLAERAVSHIMLSLAGIENEGFGFFTFGGTATNLYGIRVGLKKAMPRLSQEGLVEKVKIITTEDAHFSHQIAADWLSLGTNNVLQVEANQDRSTNIEQLERLMRKIIIDKEHIGAIILNGGTTYSHTIDNIKEIASLRTKLVKEYSIPYSPHIHVDSVIGWAWLMFKDYDFSANPLEIKQSLIGKIEQQYDKIKKIKYADSFGVDFHKGIGGCPIPCSMFLGTHSQDISYLSKKQAEQSGFHQLAHEFSRLSPVDYTLETSRPGGASLAALASLLTMGANGFRSYLANLIGVVTSCKESLKNDVNFKVCNEEPPGYVLMLRIYPEYMNNDTRRHSELVTNEKKVKSWSEEVNKYISAFFNWDFETRMNFGNGYEYSFTSQFMTAPNGAKIAGIKIYPVSPHTNDADMYEIISTIRSRKKIFDEQIWMKK